MIKRGVFLAGGNGKRLGKLGGTGQKSLRILCGKPIISYSLEILKKYGVEHAILIVDNKEQKTKFENCIDEKLIPKLKYTIYTKPVEIKQDIFKDEKIIDILKEYDSFCAPSDTVFEERMIRDLFQINNEKKSSVIPTRTPTKEHKVKMIVKDNYLQGFKKRTKKSFWMHLGTLVLRKNIAQEYCYLRSITGAHRLPEDEFLNALNKFNSDVKKKQEKIYIFDNKYTYININTRQDWEKAENFIKKTNPKLQL